MAAHSTCQPGRPGPKSDGQDGSPGRCPTHTSGSTGSFLPGRDGISAVLSRQPDHRLGVQAGNRAEAPVGRPREVRVPVKLVERSSAGQNAVEPLDQRQRLDSSDVVLRWQCPQGRHVGPEELDLAARQVTPVLAVSVRALQQRIIHVGDILHVDHLLARVQPGSHQQIPGQERSRVTDVGSVIRGDTARIERGRRAWCSFGQPAAGGVPDHRRGGRARQAGNVSCRPGVHGRQGIAARVGTKDRVSGPARTRAPGQSAAVRSRQAR